MRVHLIWMVGAALAGVMIPVQAGATSQKSAGQAASEVEKARGLLAAADTDRMFANVDYARSIQSAGATLRAAETEQEVLNAIDYLVAVSHLALGEPAKGRVLVDRIIASDSSSVDAHILALFLGDSENPLAQVEALERADRMLTGEQRIVFAKQLSEEVVGGIRQPFWVKDDLANIRRTSRVLISLGWPPEGLPSFASSLRVDMVDAALLAGNVAEAKAHAEKVDTLDANLTMVVEKKYDPVVGNDAIGRISRAIAAEERSTGELLAAKPDDFKRIVARVQYLRAIGKEQDALSLMQPHLDGVLAGSPSNTDGFWLVNEAAYTLGALGRPNEAAKLMQRINAIPLKENMELVSMSINSIEVIAQTGDYAAAAAQAEKLAGQKDIASAYGIMWMWSGAACAYSMAGQPEKAKPWLDKLKAGEKDNEAALNRALLCANDLDGSAALTLRRLASDEAPAVLRSAQTYTLNPQVAANRLPIEQRWEKVIARPEVKAAIEKKGRILRLPLSRIYYGAY